MNERADSDVDVRLRESLGTPAAADFDSWRLRHAESIACLNPVVTAAYQRRRRFWAGFAGTVAASAAIVALGMLVLGRGEASFAQTIDAIQHAESITWTITWYNRMFSQDGKRSWLQKAPRWERSYLAPDRWRDVRFDAEGRVATVDIEDVSAGKVLHLDMERKTATLKHEPSGQFGAGGPFASLTQLLEREPIELVGEREVKGRQVNVFRHRRDLVQGDQETMDLWLDAETKRLVAYSVTPGEQPFDAGTDPDRDHPAEPNFSKGTIAGVLNEEIVFDARLDPSLFSLSTPEGFQVVEPKVRPPVTEEALVEWLKAAAEANGGTFVDMDPKQHYQWESALYDKPEKNLTENERRFLALERKHANDGNLVPMHEFAAVFAAPGSFRYLGKGAKFGDGERIVCFYRRKSGGNFRAIYGDLQVRDVDRADLPLPVEE